MVALASEDVLLAPRIVRADEGERIGHGPENTRTILTSAQTGGAFTVMETTIDVPAYGPPYHVHAREDETFTVLDGSVTLILGGVRHELNVGDTAFAPRNVPHTFETGPHGVRMQIISSGDNFERFLPRFNAALAAGEMHRLAEIAGEHGITFLPANEA